MQDGVNREDIISVRVLKMTLIRNVVEVRQIFAEIALILSLLQDVLTFVPIPSLVYFAEILNNQLVRLDSFLLLAKDAQAF